MILAVEAGAPAEAAPDTDRGASEEQSAQAKRLLLAAASETRAWIEAPAWCASPDPVPRKARGAGSSSTRVGLVVVGGAVVGSAEEPQVPEPSIVTLSIPARP
jgi:hypothetical protein